MTTPPKQLLFWSPRILCLLFAAFISIFAADAFGEGYGFWKTILALLIHLIPTGIILVILAISWRWEWVGGILFIALGALSELVLGTVPLVGISVYIRPTVSHRSSVFPELAPSKGIPNAHLNPEIFMGCQRPDSAYNQWQKPAPPRLGRALLSNT